MTETCDDDGNGGGARRGQRLAHYLQRLTRVEERLENIAATLRSDRETEARDRAILHERLTKHQEQAGAHGRAREMRIQALELRAAERDAKGDPFVVLEKLKLRAQAKDAVDKLVFAGGGAVLLLLGQWLIGGLGK